jgi:hypothetical protein
MLQHWTTRRKWSLAIHIGIVLIPFCFATTSAAQLWFSLFQDWWIAVPIVVAFDVTALIGLVLYIGRIPSPFQWLRHLLPVISVVPLGLELYDLLAPHNDIWVSVLVSAVVTTAMTLIAWRCWVTIEGLFVSSAVAARELVEERLTAARQLQQEQLRMLTATLTMAADMQANARLVVQDWAERTDVRVTQALTVADVPKISTQAVKAYAEISGVSERTVWRQLEKGKLTAADVIGVSAEED